MKSFITFKPVIFKFGAIMIVDWTTDGFASII